MHFRIEKEWLLVFTLHWTICTGTFCTDTTLKQLIIHLTFYELIQLFENRKSLFGFKTELH